MAEENRGSRNVAHPFRWQKQLCAWNATRTATNRPHSNIHTLIKLKIIPEIIQPHSSTSIFFQLIFCSSHTILLHLGEDGSSRKAYEFEIFVFTHYWRIAFYRAFRLHPRYLCSGYCLLQSTARL